jgi:hypothetical protein
MHFAVMIFALLPGSSNLDRQIEFTCHGLEAYEIRVNYHVDAGGGTIRSRSDNYSIGLGLGPMMEQVVPKRRPPGFRWIKVERIGTATLRYGYNVREKRLLATIVGAPVSSLVNLASRPDDTARFLSIARTLAKATCTHGPVR